MYGTFWKCLYLIMEAIVFGYKLVCVCGYDAEIAAVQVDPPPPLYDHDPGGSLLFSIF